MRNWYLCFAALTIMCFSGTSRGDSLDDQIKAKEKAVADLEATVGPKVQPILVPDADLRLWISKTILTLVTDAFNKQPNKDFHFLSTGEVGQLKNSNGGGAGCGWFVELNPNDECRSGMAPHSACADANVSNLVSTYHDDGSFELTALVQAALAAKIHGHVKGPAGPCSIWHPIPTCDCPIGGGAGTTALVGGGNTVQVTGSAHLTSDADHWLIYNLSLTQPASVHVDVHVGLQIPFDGSFDAHFPQDIQIPQQVLAAGTIPQVFDRDGEIVIGSPPVLDKKYKLTVSPFQFSPGATGYAAKGAVSVVFR